MIEAGEKLHVIYRTLHEHSNRRHFIGEVIQKEHAVCRLDGYVFVYDVKATTYLRKPESRTTIIDLGDSGYIVNLIDRGVNLIDIVYSYERGIGLVASDKKGWSLSINEFGMSS